MKAAIIYSSVTGNTAVLAEIIQAKMSERQVEADLIPVDQFQPHQLRQYHVIAVGTYTWDNGELPMEMEEIYETIETEDVKQVTTGVFGTGDSFFSHYCGAVDLFRDMLYVHTNLAVTLKVELTPQDKDIEKCGIFCDRLVQQVMATI